MKRVCYNEPSLNTMIAEAYKELENGAVNISIEPYSKPITKRQLGFFWSALIGSIKDYFYSKGDFEWTEDAIKEILYKNLSPKIIIPDFDGNIVETYKRIHQMDRKEMSDLIDNTITLIDTKDVFKDLVLEPEIRYCWIHHLEDEDFKYLDRSKIKRKDNEYLEYIRKQACLVCGKMNETEAHHLKEAGESGVAYKVDDAEVVPLCRDCHRLYHIKGKKWFENQLKWIENYLSIDDFAVMMYNRWYNGFR